MLVPMDDAGSAAALPLAQALEEVLEGSEEGLLLVDADGGQCTLDKCEQVGLAYAHALSQR